MATMTPTISKSARARGDAPEPFVEICKRLYGGAVDPQDVWDEVFKASPDQADVNAHNTRRRVLESVALTSTAAGGILGVKEGIAGVRGVRTARRAGRAVSGKAWRSLGLAGAATGGDAVTTGVLASDNKKPRRQAVGKSALVLVPTGNVAKNISLARLPKLDKVATGVQRGWKAMTPTVKPASVAAAGRPVSGPLTQSQTRARNVGRDAATALNTTTGKVMAGALAVGGANKVNASAKRRTSNVDFAPDYYGKADDAVVDVEFGGTFSKFDDDKRQVFGWASVVKVNGAPVVDRQGDYIDSDDLEAAAYSYVHKSRVGGDMHKRTSEYGVDSAHKVSDMIESMVFTPDKIAKMGLPEDFPVGWWVGYQIHDEPTWDLVKKRGRTGFSIHGKGLRKAQDLDQLMGYTQ